MKKGRLEAFSDGVIAILITIMVLELKVPHGATWEAVEPMWPVLLSYAISFIYLGIYWNNHHHMLHLAERIDGKVLWANLLLLFWLSLVPFATSWMGEYHDESLPSALYGGILLAAGVSFVLLRRTLQHAQGPHSKLEEALGKDTKGQVSSLLYAAAVGLAFVNSHLSQGIYIVVALIWIVPDTRAERALAA